VNEVSIPWEGIPNWIVAGTGLLTLIAAAVAAGFAGRAAHWAKKQSTTAEQQVTIAKEQLANARTELDVAQRAADQSAEAAARAERRAIESRLDLLQPAVYARATAGTPGAPNQLLMVRDNRDPSWRPVTDDLDIPAGGEMVTFSLNVTLTFRNVSSQTAEIAIPERSLGEIQLLPQGRSLFLAPGEDAQVVWTRLIHESEARSPERPGWSMFRVKAWVRDLGVNVRDEYVFSDHFPFFSMDGSLLRVRPAPWGDCVAVIAGPRIYERLDAGRDAPGT